MERTGNGAGAVRLELAVGLAPTWTDSIEHIGKPRGRLIRLNLARVAILLSQVPVLLSNTQLLHDASGNANVGPLITGLTALLVLVYFVCSWGLRINILAVSLENHPD